MLWVKPCSCGLGPPFGFCRRPRSAGCEKTGDFRRSTLHRESLQSKTVNGVPLIAVAMPLTCQLPRIC